VEMAENDEDQLDGKKIERGSIKHDTGTKTNYQMIEIKRIIFLTCI